MQTNLFLMLSYSSSVNVDPSRIGASVVSGIGFLGAGTIIKEGASVKGLTTAASLWAVACIGLAVGSGFYVGSIAGTIIILLTLTMFFKFERKMSFNRSEFVLDILTISHPGQLGKIGTVLGKLDTKINDIEMEPHNEKYSKVLISILPPRDVKISKIITLLSDVEDIKSITVVE
jgi:putative Mg2+ transporter-C (MgtC) family protein